MSYRNHARCAGPLCALLLTFTLPPCVRAQKATPTASGEPAYTVLGTDAVSTMHSRVVRSITLGDIPSHRPGMVTDALILKDKLFVLDGMKRVLLVYDQDGKYLTQANEWGDSDGALRSPVKLLAVADSVFVLDLTHQNAVSAFDLQGRFIGARFPDLHRASAFRMAVGRATAAFAQADALDRPDKTVVSIRDLRGREIGTGCAISEIYTKSEARHGALAHFTASFVALRGNRIFCAQAVSPVIAVLDLSGNTLSYLPFAPPFYLAPPADINETQNQKVILDFQSKWTTMQEFTISAADFVSIYSQFDVASMQFKYKLFTCGVESAPKNCRTAELPGRPVHVLSSSSILSVMPAEKGVVTLHVLELTR